MEDSEEMPGQLTSKIQSEGLGFKEGLNATKALKENISALKQTKAIVIKGV